MNEQVLELLPEINEIEDVELREKVIACWAEAMEYREWTVDELRSIPFTLLAENVQIFFIEQGSGQVFLLIVAVNHPGITSLEQGIDQQQFLKLLLTFYRGKRLVKSCFQKLAG